MSFETFVRQLQIWQNSNADVPVNGQYQDLVEFLKINKDKKELVKYVGNHILPVLNTQCQTVKDVIECSDFDDFIQAIE